MQSTTTRVLQIRVVNPHSKAIVGYERLRLTPDGAIWEYSLDGKSWDKGLFEGDEYIRDQSSGVMDRNHKLIYENDIVSYAGHVNTVVFQRGAFGYRAKTNGNFNAPEGRLWPLYEKMEVVGNTHTNAELVGDNA